jgi:hypothetical protein
VEVSKAAILSGYVVEMERNRSWRTGVAYRNQVSKEETGSRTGQLETWAIKRATTSGSEEGRNRRILKISRP